MDSAQTETLEGDVRNLNGQRIGPKGQRTMRKLIDAAAQLLESTGLRDLSVAEVARSAGTSPATFYVYFEGVPELVLEALKTAPHCDDELLRLASDDWSADPTRFAEEFVDLYIARWQRHRTLYRVRNLASEEGDKRFVDARSTAARPVLDALSRNVAHSKSCKRIDTKVSDFAVAAAIVMMLERVSALYRIMPEMGDGNAGELRDAAVFAALQILGY
jgi:AcrR family transcriptional regulator